MKKLFALVLTSICIWGMVGCFDSDGEKNNENLADGAKKDLSEIAVDMPLNPETSSGIGVEIAYESEDMLIFYGEFGLFVYDLKENEPEFSVDFVKAIGIEGSVQGSYGTAVDVSADGNTVIISEYNAETETRGKTCRIDVSSQTYEYGEYEPLENAFQKENVNGYIYPGVNLNGIKYILGEKEIGLFE